MLEIVGFSLSSLLANLLGGEPRQLDTAQVLAWHDAALFSLAEPDPQANPVVEEYLKSLASQQGAAAKDQGLWMESGINLLVDHQGDTPLSAASLTKIATTLAALEKWGHTKQFETKIFTTGSLAEVRGGVLEGDLVIQGQSDPFFIWEEAIAVGNALNEMGIRRITGNLIIVGDFYMNFRPNPQAGGEIFKIAVNSDTWDRDANYSYSKMPADTPKPQLTIAGNVVVQEEMPEGNLNLLLRHKSLSLAEILKQMNIYSNNAIAESLAVAAGGPEEVASVAVNLTDVPAAEIQLINGSGLGVGNRISPRATCAMFRAIEEKLETTEINVFDLFPVAGRDEKGTLSDRDIPPGTAIKTGTLNQVSALAGLMPTQDKGTVCFAIINGGTSTLLAFRRQQDQLLSKLSQQWGVAGESKSLADRGEEFPGDPQRNWPN